MLATNIDQLAGYLEANVGPSQKRSDDLWMVAKGMREIADTIRDIAKETR